MMTVARDRLIALAQRLIEAKYDIDAEVDRDMAEFARGVPHPRPSDLIYYWQNEFDHEPTAEEVVDRALHNRPIEL
jgi:Colicin immunity protein / pyocin immunity protein